jgi:predicted metal-dependent hydrolase
MKIIRSRRKTYTLVVTREGELLVRAPLRATDAQVEALVREKSAWIEEKQKLVHKLVLESAPHAYQPGERFWFLGQQYPLEISPTSKSALALVSGRFHLARSHQPHAQTLFERWYRREARQVLQDRVQALAAIHSIPMPVVRISSARTRWGSCSGRGTLSFPWRLVLAPPEVIDYVVVHELAHLSEHNHSSRFWERVAAMMPDYKHRLRWLKENGHKLVV